MAPILPRWYFFTVPLTLSRRQIVKVVHGKFAQPNLDVPERRRQPLVKRCDPNAQKKGSGRYAHLCGLDHTPWNACRWRAAERGNNKEWEDCPPLRLDLLGPGTVLSAPFGYDCVTGTPGGTRASAQPEKLGQPRRAVGKRTRGFQRGGCRKQDQLKQESLGTATSWDVYEARNRPDNTGPAIATAACGASHAESPA